MTSAFALNGRNVESYAAVSGAGTAKREYYRVPKAVSAQFTDLASEDGAGTSLVSKMGQDHVISVLYSSDQAESVKGAIKKFGAKLIDKTKLSFSTGGVPKALGTVSFEDWPSDKRFAEALKAKLPYAEIKVVKDAGYPLVHFAVKKADWQSAVNIIKRIDPSADLDGPDNVGTTFAAAAADTPAQWGQRLLVTTTPNNALLMHDALKRMSNRPIEKQGNSFVVYSNYPKAVLKIAQTVDPKATMKQDSSDVAASISPKSRQIAAEDARLLKLPNKELEALAGRKIPKQHLGKEDVVRSILEKKFGAKAVEQMELEEWNERYPNNQHKASLSLSAGKQYTDYKTWLKDANEIGYDVSKKGGLYVVRDRDGRVFGEFNVNTSKGEIRSKYAGQPVPTREERDESLRKMMRGEFKHPVKSFYEAAAASGNLRYVFPDERSAERFIAQVLTKLGLKGGYRGRAAVVLRPGMKAADVSDLAQSMGGKPTAAAASLSLSNLESGLSELLKKKIQALGGEFSTHGILFRKADKSAVKALIPELRQVFGREAVSQVLSRPAGWSVEITK